jgi:hypothetical protein
LPVFDLLINYLEAPVAHEALFKKYASKKFLKGKLIRVDPKGPKPDPDAASILARKWAKDYGNSRRSGGVSTGEVKVVQ